MIPPKRKKVLVTGAGGFIGGHLVRRLYDEGCDVWAVDIKPLDAWEVPFPRGGVTGVKAWSADLRDTFASDFLATNGYWDEVYNLAADMGGMGFIETHKVDCMRSVLISSNVIDAVDRAGCGRYFYSSSACVYAGDKQTETDVTALVESDAYPADPEDGYGWEKLFSERMCRHYLEERGLPTRVARFHNVYGTHTTWHGGREKAPAAICRKVASAVLHGYQDIEVWGDGEQTRSFMWIDDCIDGILIIARGDNPEPVNLGSSELVSINQLVSIVEGIADVRLKRVYNLEAPKGVRGRNSDNRLIVERYGWEPTTPLSIGMEMLYDWVYEQVAERYAGGGE